MFDKLDKRGSRKRVSRGNVFLWSSIAASGALTLILPSFQDENLVQVGMSGVLVWIIVRGYNRSEALLAAALQLAEELAKRETRDERAPDNGLALVVPLPRGRRRKAS